MSVKQYQKKIILQVVPSLNAGGVERGTLEIAKKIVESGNKSIVISSGGRLVKQLESSGSLHLTLNVASKNPFVMWYNSKRIAELISRYNIDIVHVRSRAPAWSCYRAAKETGIKLLTTFHGIYNFNNGIKKYYNSIMTEGKKVIAVSNFVKKHILENYDVSEKKVQVIHRGVNHEEFSKDKITPEINAKYRSKYNAPLNTPILLLPSRMTRWKGHLTLIDALNEVRDLNFYCIVAGDLSKHPKYVDEIKQKIHKYKIKNRVQLFGNEPNMMALYGIADIVLSTSIEPEAFGRTIIEAQSMEKLVIASNIGGACETIENGKSGFHFEPGDHLELAEKIKHSLSILGSDEHKNITNNARKSVKEKFSLDLMLKETLSIYDKL
ncbi:MAG: hypothetical protein DGJ47_000202 [Rickettsiaceae bacterium]